MADSKNKDKSIDDKLEKLLNNQLYHLDIPEIASLCTEITEKYLKPDNELYVYYHELLNNLKNNT